MAVIRIERDGKQTTVYVAGTEGDIWAFHEGRVFHQREQSSNPAKAGHYSATAPMPATVVKIFVAPGQQVRHNDTLLVLEAMKMELPIRAPGDATVKAINCREGELVQPDRTLVELE